METESQYLPTTLPSTQEQRMPNTTMTIDMTTAGWYSSIPATPPFNDFGFENPYATPHTSSLGAFSPITDFGKSEFPAFTKGQELVLEVPKTGDSYPFGFVPVDNTIPARPRSSPSTFSPISGGKLDDYLFNANALGISGHGFQQQPFRQQTYPGLQSPRTPGRLGSEPTLQGIVPQVIAPVPRRMYAPIAPNPQQTLSRKRTLDEDESSPDDAKRRKRSDSLATTTELTEEDKLLMKLKEEENLPWKDIAARFQSDLGKKYQIPALQMRLKRLRERLRVWTEQDVKALRAAHDYWIQSKYDIIASKMMDFGASDRWTSKQVSRKWQEIDPGPTPYSTYEASTPSLSYTTSPIEAPYLPFLHIPQ